MREDPVRMLRAVRFAAKLDFEIDEPVIKSIDHHSHLLANVPAARLFDEFLKLFQAGNAERTFDLLRDHGLFTEMFPATDHELASDEDFMRFTRAALQNTDRRVSEGKSVTPMFLLGVFLWRPIAKLAEIRRSEEKMSESQSLSSRSVRDRCSAAAENLDSETLHGADARNAVAAAAFRFKRGKRAMKLLDHRRFRAAYDFMLLLSEVGQGSAQTAQFWTDVQTQSAAERASSFELGQPTGQKTRRPRRRRRKKPEQSS